LETLGADHLDYQDIAGLLDAQPWIRQRMAALNREGVLTHGG
jgi:hypothetical protein